LDRHRLIFLSLSISVLLCLGCARQKNEKAFGTESRPRAGMISEKQTVDTRPVIVAIGDSLTAGQGVDPAMNYPSQLQKKIDAGGYRYRVVNAGVSGDTSSQGLNRLQSILDIKPSIAIVELGANDGLRGLPPDATRQNLETIVQQLQSAGTKIVLAGMEVPPNYGPQYAGEFRKIFKDVSKKYQVALVPFFLERVGGIASLNQDDGIHPTAEGYAIVVENVWKVLQPLL
jgi:acyl-CoA thioesterase-1